MARRALPLLIAPVSGVTLIDPTLWHHSVQRDTSQRLHLFFRFFLSLRETQLFVPRLN